MARCTALIVMLAACSGGDAGDAVNDAGDAGDDGRLVWTWSFVDPTTHTEVGCPANVQTVDLVAYYTRVAGECSEPLGSAARKTIACSLGRGALDPQLAPSQPCLSKDRFSVRVIATTDDGLTYANEGGGITIAPAATGEGHTDIASPRGFIRLTWTLVGSDGTPRSCPGSSVIRTSLTSLSLDRYDCAPGSAVLIGVAPGLYDFTTDLLWRVGSSNSYGQGQVTGVSVAAGEITDAAVTLVLPNVAPNP